MKAKENKILCCEKPLEWQDRQGDGSYVPQTADCPDCHAYFERRPNSEIAYKSLNDGASYKCAKCDGEIQGARIAHPIHDGPFPLFGSGRCHTETVPYCPKCEENPDSNGSIIKVPFG